MVFNSKVFLLRASATLLLTPDLCFNTKLNCWRKETHLACLLFNFFWLLMCFKAS
ncbi:hypothetical protein RchiOBHm_Chr6g0247881 [Rosa chinensis]|uniref:Uncharacterized protein n=1 Tax=Rosa chinensis TaxID=74649 RepID=A0A2P6PJV7_ROSCH|nr:hypothetical protein RchiOBHm_Chr6g0247881 [Rosa chinensis]